VWPRAEQGLAVLTPAQLSMLLEGIVWTPSAGQQRIRF
jgi:transposase